MTRVTPRFVLTLLAASALSACASPEYPTRLAESPTSAPSAVLSPPVAAPASAPARDEDGFTPPKRSAPVESRTLEPPAARPLASAERLTAQPAVYVASEGQPEWILTASRKRTRTHAAAASDGPQATYTVRKGDTLGKIADRLGVTIPALKSANGLKSNAINPGDVLKNPKAKSEGGGSRSSRAAREDREERAASETYKVKKGDTLFSIAKRFKTTESDLRAANGLSKRGQIKAGQTLKVGGEAQANQPMETAGRDTPDRSMASDRSAAGRVVEVAGSARTYRVRKGDNLSEVADKLDMGVAELAKLNKLKKPYRLRAGQVIRGKSTTAKAYVVASGDTLGEIARRFDVSETALRGANGLKRGARVAPGRKLRLPAGYHDRGARNPIDELETPYPRREPPPVTPSRREPQGELPGGPQPYVPPRVPYRPPVVPPASSGGGLFGAPTASPTPSDGQLSQLGRGLFIWPLRGEILSGYGPKAGGQGNDGVDVRAPMGEPVRAAAAGDVIYAGDQVPGYGNLVLIRHPDGWVTAYSHMSRVDVRMQQKVIQGQQVGQVGTTGGVSEPQLHFEVRYQPNAQERAKPIDPMLVLPRP